MDRNLKKKEKAFDETIEEWRDIEGYEGKYMISSLGRIMSLEYHNAKGIKRKGLLKPAIDGKGYLRCALSKGNILTTYKVHRLVALAFIPNPLNLPQVNHKDCNKQNNSIDNLEWCNNSYNQLHAYKNGLNKYHAPRAKRTILTNKDTGEELVFEQKRHAATFLGFKSVRPIERAFRLNITTKNYYVTIQ